MADITWSTVTDVAPDMATGVTVGFQTLILGYVNERVDPDQFGGESSSTYTLARAYLAAHFGAIYKSGTIGASGPVTSKSEGGVSVSFAVPTSFSTSNLGETAYGRAFATLVRQSPANAGLVAL